MHLTLTNFSVLKYFSILLLISLFTLGCSSSKKDSKTSQSNDSGVEQAAQPESPALTTQLFSSSADTAGLTALSGQLNYTGNEPFTFPALFVSGGSATYKLSADTTFMEETFKSLSGKTVTIYGKTIESDNSTLFEVHYYELKNN